MSIVFQKIRGVNAQGCNVLYQIEAYKYRLLRLSDQRRPLYMETALLGSRDGEGRFIE